MTSSDLTPQQLERFLPPGLLQTPGYSLAFEPAQAKLDQNEMPSDWPVDVKRHVADSLVTVPWNRYPRPYDEEVHELVAQHVELPPDRVMIGPGSNFLLSNILTMLHKTTGDIVLSVPGFPLCAAHCRYIERPFVPWPHNKDLEFELSLLPPLKPGSLVVFASPNNPRGNVLDPAAVAELVRAHPDVLFLADEAYSEIYGKSCRELLMDAPNLMVVRTFSKDMAAAGVRLGYLLAAPSIIEAMRKITVPFLMTPFSLLAAKAVLTHPQMREYRRANRANTLAARDKLYRFLERLEGVQVYPSEANFLLARWPGEGLMRDAYKRLRARGILVRDVSQGPGLEGCLRITVGSETENEMVRNALMDRRAIM